MSDALILGFDTSAAHCAAALLCGDRVLVSRAEAMTRGQAERLMPMLEDVLAESGKVWADLTRIGVGVGPGNFTGIRIGVSAARGLALALAIPAIGVTTFEAIGTLCPAGHLPAVPAPRDHVYVEQASGAQVLVPAEGIAALAGTLAFAPEPGELACRIARIAAHAAPGAAPAPLYLRAADAAPARDTPPRILDAG